MADLKPKTVDGFIDLSPEESQEVMIKLKNLIEVTEPKAEGGISWNVPIYKYNGILAGFSLAKKHVSFGIVETPDIVYHLRRTKVSHFWT